jgi:hypothetical protein
MGVIVGSDGGVQINLGGGLKYVANIFSWNVNMGRNMLRTTTQADEAERRTAGLADWTGDFSMRLQFSDDTNVAQSSWQMLNFALTGVDDGLKADLRLMLQSYQVLPEDCDIFRTTIPGIISLVGTVVIGDVRLDCTDPGEPIILVLSWSGDGALTLQRS